MEKQKNRSLKMSNGLIVIGIIIVVIGALLLMSPINDIKARNAEVDRIKAEYDLAMDNYEQEYDEWQEAWIKGQSSINDAPDMPSFPDTPSVPVGAVLLIMGCGIMIFVGISIIIAGAQPYMLKHSLKRSKETLDYVGDDIKEVGETIGDIGGTVINNTMDDNADEPRKNKNVTNSKKTTKCSNCGAPIKGTTCEYCGMEQ